jgi:hypothetical protein
MPMRFMTTCLLFLPNASISCCRARRVLRRRRDGSGRQLHAELDISISSCSVHLSIVIHRAPSAAIAIPPRSAVRTLRRIISKSAPAVALVVLLLGFASQRCGRSAIGSTQRNGLCHAALIASYKIEGETSAFLNKELGAAIITSCHVAGAH